MSPKKLAAFFDEMKTLIEHLKEQGLREQFKVMVGGGAISASFAEEIGADAYVKDSNEAVKIAELSLIHI